MGLLHEEMRKSIRLRFLGFISSILLLSTIVLSTVIAINEKAMLLHSLMSKGTSFTSYIAKLSQDPLIMKDYILLDSLVNEANKDDDFLYCLIQDPQGKIVTSQYSGINYKSPRISALLAGLPRDIELPDILTHIKNKEPYWEHSNAIMSGNIAVGTITLCLSQYKIRKQIVKTIFFVVGLNVIVALALGVVLFFVSKKMIFDPLDGLAHTAQRFAKGNLGIRITIKAVGEVQVLLNSFNQMADDLEKTTVSRDYVDNIIKSMIDALIVIDESGFIKNSNAAACKLLGYTEDELAGKKMNLILEGGAPLTEINSEEKILRAKTGLKIPVLLSVSMMHDRDGKVEGFVCVAQDITERKKAEEKLERFAAELEASNSELESFAYVASHDLQEPLRKITVFGERINTTCKDILTEQAKDYFERMMSAAGRMHILINDLLTFSRLTTKAKPFEPVDLNTVACEVISDLEIRIQDSGGRVEVGDLPVVKADPLQMRQLLQNLIGNALKFRRPDAPSVVTIQAQCIKDQGKGGTDEMGCDEKIALTVEDNGIGFDEKYVDRIFGVFQRLHGRGEYEGTGIGLAICKKIAERHGGTITAKSVEGQGARFIVTLCKR
jgi:two-component system sensor kinase FixL